jgi:hypothetical protein
MAFLNATGGNWRNSLYIDCRVCRVGRCDHPDFLYVPDENGGVIILPVRDAEIVFGRMMDKSECLNVISNAQFADLFAQYLKRFEGGEYPCALLRLCTEQSKQPEV